MKLRNASLITREYMERGRSESCPIIDLHGHWGPLSMGYLPAAPEEKMIRVLERAGVRVIVCSAHEALFGNPAQGNAQMQAAIERHPRRLAGYWSVNPNLDTSWQQAASDFEVARGFMGFKLLPDYHTYPLDGSRYQPALEFANTRRLLVLVHTWGGSPFNGPDRIATVAARYPKAVFLMGHSCFGAWEQAVTLARDYPNVYLDITAVYVAHDFAVLPYGSGTPLPLASGLHVNGIIEYMVARAGPDKIVFGTDLPWYSPYYAAGAVLFAHIDEQARRDILYRNAERLLADNTAGSDLCAP